MGAGASVEAEGAATKDEVVAFAGDAFDAGAWDAAAKDDAGRVAWADVAAHVKTSAIEGTTEGGYVYGAAARRASVSAAMRLIETEKSSEEVLDALAPTPGMDRAARLFHALATHVSTMSETLGSGFGASYRGAHVNYARLFKACDVDAAGMMDKQELILTLRTTLKLKKRVMTDGDIGFLFDMIDGDESGVVTMAEFNMFAKGIAPTPSARRRRGSSSTRRRRARSARRRRSIWTDPRRRASSRGSSGPRPATCTAPRSRPCRRRRRSSRSTAPCPWPAGRACRSSRGG
jgi:Ca2+-binding EF-hand superfamily protein